MSVANIGGDQTFTCSGIFPLTASDTAYVTFAVLNGAKIIGFMGGQSSTVWLSSFSGCLIC